MILANITLASVYQQIGDYPKALSILETNLALVERSLDRHNLQVAMILNLKGSVHYADGDYSAAEQAFRRCLKIREVNIGTDSPAYAATVNNLAVLLMDRNKLGEASTLFKDAAIALDKSVGKYCPELATVLCNWGELSEALGQLSFAKGFYEEAIAIREKAFGLHHPATADSIARYASLQLQLGSTNYALQFANHALAIRREFFNEYHPVIAENMDLLGDVYSAQGDQDQAVRCYSKSAEIRHRSLGWGHPLLTTSLEKVAVAYQAAGEYPLAIEALASIFPMRRHLLTTQFGRAAEVQVQQTAHTMARTTDLYHSLLVAAPSAADLILSERGAEQAALNKCLLEELELVRAVLESQTNTETRTLRGAYLTLQRQADDLEIGELPRVERESRRRELQSQLVEIETQLGNRVALVAERIRARQYRLVDIAMALPKRSCLVDFVRFNRFDFSAHTNRWKGPRYVAYLTFPAKGSSTNFDVKRVDLGEAAPIDKALDTLRRRMSSGEFIAPDLPPALQLLSDRVYARIAPLLRGVTHMIICPDGELNRLPFELLPVEGKFLVQQIAISYVSCGREVISIAANSKSGRPDKVLRSLIFGNPDFDLNLHNNNSSTRSSPDGPSTIRASSHTFRGLKFRPLPETEAEARQVAAFLGGSVELRVGVDARESALKASSPPCLLHLATHGFFLPSQEFKLAEAASTKSPTTFIGEARNAATNAWENPLVRCGLAFAGANNARNAINLGEEDGLLTGLEASLLNLHGTDLVVLSACDTGTGEMQTGEGVMSLRRGFTIAGAQSVLASHWRVSDRATKELTTEFIRRWRAGTPRAEAWRQSQISLMQSKEFSNPYFWAAFTLTGQWN